MARDAISQIEDGKSLADIGELDSKVYPSLAAILSHIDSSEELSKLKSQAEKSRLSILKETVLRAAESFKNNPCNEAKEVFVNLEKLYSSLAKAQVEDERVILEYQQALPDDFWDKQPEPEHPREVKE